MCVCSFTAAVAAAADAAASVAVVTAVAALGSEKDDTRVGANIAA